MDKRLFILLLFLLVGCQISSGDLEWHREDGYRWTDIELSYFGGTGFNKLEPSKTNFSFEVFQYSGRVTA